MMCAVRIKNVLSEIFIFTEAKHCDCLARKEGYLRSLPVSRFMNHLLREVAGRFLHAQSDSHTIVLGPGVMTGQGSILS